MFIVAAFAGILIIAIIDRAIEYAPALLAIAVIDSSARACFLPVAGVFPRAYRCP
jgi:hypothetical protein